MAKCVICLKDDDQHLVCLKEKGSKEIMMLPKREEISFVQKLDSMFIQNVAKST